MALSEDRLASLLARIRACAICAADLPHGPRPVIRAAASARLLLIGQAPGTRVHETGIPWNDRSGDRLREWTALAPDAFYDETEIALVPMGFCFPGTDPRGGDLPPRPECAPTWHRDVLALLPNVELTLPIGDYAQTYHLGERRKRTVTETVAAWREFLPDVVPLPHPSWRNTAWLKRNPWFEAELVPDLRRRVAAVLARRRLTSPDATPDRAARKRRSPE